MSNNLTTKDIRNEVRQVLESVLESTPNGRPYMTAYQILAALPDKLRETLIEERGMPGANAGVYYSAASLVSDTAEKISGVEKSYFNTRNTNFQIDQRNKHVEPGCKFCGLYRLP